MSDLLLALARDLPSTAVLLLMMYLVNRQFSEVLSVVKAHLDDISRLLERCLDGKLEHDEAHRWDRDR